MQDARTFGAAVSELKCDIAAAVQAAIDKFESMTGVTPSSVQVPILEITAHGDLVRKHCVGDVIVGFGEF